MQAGCAHLTRQGDPASPATLPLILAGAIELAPLYNNQTLAVVGACAAGDEGAACRSEGDGGTVSGWLPGGMLRAPDLRTAAFRQQEGIDRAALCVYGRNLRELTR